jgi:uncharacterized protein
MQDNKFENKNINNLLRAGLVFLIIASIALLMFAINLYREGKLIGANANNTITVSGTGKVEVKPDTANITFTVRDSGKTSKEGEIKVAEKVDKALQELKKIIEEENIKTENYNSYPKYFYPQNAPARIDGYEVSQTISLKIYDLDKVSDIISIVSGAGINEVSGPSFTVDNDDAYKQEARQEAISEAKEKAYRLARQLDVDLVRIVGFSEDGNYASLPYARTEMTMAGMSMIAKDAAAPALPTGQNEVTSNVSITFEIK